MPMHFGRSHSRSKSRSPAPGSSFSPATPASPYSRPPNFLPPSHYAAAAGIGYSNSVGGLKPEDQHQPSSPAHVYVEETEPRDPSVGGVGKLMGRASSGWVASKRAQETYTHAQPPGQEKGFRDRRMSQLGDIPLLEAQLLPTLRDTVDRMTQPHQSRPDQSEHMEYQSISTSPRRRREDTYFSTSSLRSGNPTPDPGSATGIPRLNHSRSPVPKSVLKSAARRSTYNPTLLESRSPQPRQYPQPEHIGPSDLSLGTLSGSDTSSEVHLARDISRPTKSPALKSTPKLATSLPKPKAIHKARSNPSTPQTAQSSAPFATPQPDRPSLMPQSSLPRLRVPRQNQVPSSDSGSELERRVSQKHSPGRLVVTNAVIVPSSSESDHSMKSRNRRSQWISPHDIPALPPTVAIVPPRQESSSRSHRDVSIISTDAQHQRNAAVGLGLSLRGVQLERQDANSQPASDDESMYDDNMSDHSLLTDEPILVQSSEDDDDSLYDEPCRLPRSTDHANLDQAENRRQEALLGLVDGLGRDYGRTLPSEENSTLERDERDWDYREQSLVTSSSHHQATRTGLHRDSQTSRRSRHSARQDSDAESMYSDQGADDHEAARANDDDDGWIPQASPRHQAQRHGANVCADSSMRSLRKTRMSWMKQSKNLVSHENAPQQDRRSPLLESKERLRSVASLSTPASPRSSPRPTRSTSPLPGVSSPKPSSRSRTDNSVNDTGRLHSKALSAHARKVGTSANNGRDSPAPVRTSVLAEGWDDEPRRQDDVGLRERLAFGIPESLSYNGSNAASDTLDSVRPHFSRTGSDESTRHGLPRVDSEVSVVESTWAAQDRFSKELSRGAAALFETLASKDHNVRSGRRVREDSEYDLEQDRTPLAEHASWDAGGASPSHARSRSRSPLPAANAADPRENAHARRRSVDSASQSSSSSSSIASVYDEPASPARPAPPSPRPPSRFDVTPAQGPREPPGSWRSTLPVDTYRSLDRQHGRTEMDRQELLHELLTSEKAFVRHSRHVIRTYFLPLRARDSRTWLPGLPPDLTRLFDWLEDIANVHAAIARALAGATAGWKSGTVALRVGGTLRALVTQLEVYMPYLVKLDAARETLRWHQEKDGGELGEYLRMKERERGAGEWGLVTLLEEPATRLRRYVEMFQRLCELTPREHPDHLAAKSLLYSTRMVIKVMEEVKLREDEYDFVKDLASRINGLSPEVPLARRARRLLWYGYLIQSDAASSALDSATGPPNASPSRTAVPSPSLRRAPAQRASRLVSAVKDWDARRARSGSASSYASSLLSVQTSDTVSSASSASVLATPRSDRFRGWDIRARSGSLSQKKALGADAHVGHVHVHVQPEARERGYGSGRPLNVMVFTDLIVLAMPAEERDGGGDGPEREQRCHLLSGLGLSRILEVFETKDGSLTVDVVAISPEHLDSGFMGEDASVVPITLVLPSSENSEGARTELLAALHKCQQHTVRSLSFPSLPGTMMDDVELDTRQSLVGILASGLPLPKSPSIQFDEANKGQRRDAVDGEREERGWWTLRFQQVLRELQREEIPMSVSVAESCPPGATPAAAL
ncbi:hypothetical protein C8Q80DRAFT_1198706 [Daedaleopsis nitida]|nr:hypothetical protein C8Q80DRAFT_1198706 [Daedaleopsis nitida]